MQKHPLRKKVSEQLQAYNDTMMKTKGKRFASFQNVMLQTMKELLIQMISKISNQQRSKLLSPSHRDMIHIPN